MRWQPGEHILWCYRREVRPVTVVADDERGLVVWLAAGTPLLVAVPEDGHGIRERPLVRRFTDPRVYAVRPWHGAGVLKIAPPGAAYSVWRFQHDDGAHRGWYANLEAPLRRSPAGVHTVDHVLDVWLDADGTIALKDEDELAVTVEAGRFTPEDVARVRAEADVVAAAMARRDYPFDDCWRHWAPDPAWPTPPLPSHLAALAGRPGDPAALAALLSGHPAPP